MKDFAVRLYDSKAKEMVIVTDVTLNTYYKLHTGLKAEEPMIASPYYDINGERLFENDVVMWPIFPKGSENSSWRDIEKFPTQLEDCVDIGDKEIEYYVVCFEDTWYLKGQSGVYSELYVKMKEKRIRYDNWQCMNVVNENSIKYVKIGDIWSCAKTIEHAKKAHAEKEEAEKREKELQCLMKLKEKYEGII